VKGQGPLAGVRIVDSTWAAAGPYATEVAALLGAEVVKVETALYPDLFRRLVSQPDAGLDASSRFNALNMRKLGLRLNLQTRGGRDVFERLIKVSDAFMENFRPGVVERLGISYDDLTKVRPDLVMVSVSAAGRGGPHSDHPGYASIFNAMGGLGHLTGYSDGPPTEVRDSVDLRVASVAAFALMAALLHRARTGCGQWIDISGREAIASMVGDALVEYALTGSSPMREGNRSGIRAPYGVFRCRGEDAWVAIGVGSDSEWAGLCEAMERPGLNTDPRFADRLLRYERIDELETLVGTWTATLIPAEAAGRCRAAGVPASEVFGGSELLTDPHLAAREVFQELEHPLLGRQQVVRGPWLLRSGDPPLEPAPLLGQHNEDILKDLLGYDPEEIERMRAACVFE
jgi:benzylsuccinate CoA-transferase BbsF subunit